MSKEADRRFWAEKISDEIENRKLEDPIVIKGAVSPSGSPHLGHLNEIMRGYYVAEVLRGRGYSVRQIFTSDDKDALRKIPNILTDENWDLVGLGDIDAKVLGKNLGVPYSEIPNPFNSEYKSYGDHFTALLKESAEMAGVPIEFISTTDMYNEGAFDETVREALQNLSKVREILSKYQRNVSEDYIPFIPQCEKCRRLTTGVKRIDMELEVIEYECEGFADAEGSRMGGCGHRGVATFREGKLSWRFEWPADWKVLKIDFEPFGKDHAEGSWPSGQEIAREIFGIEPPIPMVYEWFTIGGKALSSSKGNIVTIRDLVELVEPEIVRYFFAKNPNKQRDLNLEKIDILVDEFDEFEREYYGENSQKISPNVSMSAYPMVVKNTVEKWVGEGDLGAFKSRRRIPYRFAAALGMNDDRNLQIEIANRRKIIDKDMEDWVTSLAIGRVERGRQWAENYQNEYNYQLSRKVPEIEIDGEIGRALEELASFVEEGHNEVEIQEAIYEIAKNNEIEIGQFFEVNYRLLFAQERGPRLGPLLAALDREFVVMRLRREG
tara:strand:+ start:24547 stop:26199 length:1653 start_codon:yes stop_codon:yes gene_type:complete